MTLKVGERYRAMWAGEPAWIVITRIELDEAGNGTIHISPVGNWPRFLWWCFPTNDISGAQFLDRLEDAARIDAELHKRSVPEVVGPRKRSVSEVEVRYR